MLFEEAVMLAETVRNTEAWKMLRIELAGGEIYYVHVRNEITGMTFLLTERADWDQLHATTQRALLDLKKMP